MENEDSDDSTQYKIVDSLQVEDIENIVEFNLEDDDYKILFDDEEKSSSAKDGRNNNIKETTLKVDTTIANSSGSHTAVDTNESCKSSDVYVENIEIKTEPVAVDTEVCCSTSTTNALLSTNSIKKNEDEIDVKYRRGSSPVIAENSNFSCGTSSPEIIEDIDGKPKHFFEKIEKPKNIQISKRKRCIDILGIRINFPQNLSPSQLRLYKFLFFRVKRLFDPIDRVKPHASIINKAYLALGEITDELEWLHHEYENQSKSHILKTEINWQALQSKSGGHLGNKMQNSECKPKENEVHMENDCKNAISLPMKSEMKDIDTKTDRKSNEGQINKIDNYEDAWEDGSKDQEFDNDAATFSKFIKRANEDSFNRDDTKKDSGISKRITYPVTGKQAKAPANTRDSSNTQRSFPSRSFSRSEKSKMPFKQQRGKNWKLKKFDQNNMSYGYDTARNEQSSFSVDKPGSYDYDTYSSYNYENDEPDAHGYIDESDAHGYVDESALYEFSTDQSTIDYNNEPASNGYTESYTTYAADYTTGKRRPRQKRGGNVTKPYKNNRVDNFEESNFGYDERMQSWESSYVDSNEYEIEEASYSGYDSESKHWNTFQDSFNTNKQFSYNNIENKTDNSFYPEYNELPLNQDGTNFTHHYHKRAFKRKNAKSQDEGMSSVVRAKKFKQDNYMESRLHKKSEVQPWQPSQFEAYQPQFDVARPPRARCRGNARIRRGNFGAGTFRGGEKSRRPSRPARGGRNIY